MYLHVLATALTLLSEIIWQPERQRDAKKEEFWTSVMTAVSSRREQHLRLMT